MENKEKQIKLLIRRINKIQNRGVKYEPNSSDLFVDNEELAEELIKHYQPKLPEDSVMLSREENERLNKKIYDLGMEIELNLNQIAYLERQVDHFKSHRDFMEDKKQVGVNSERYYKIHGYDSNFDLGGSHTHPLLCIVKAISESQAIEYAKTLPRYSDSYHGEGYVEEVKVINLTKELLKTKEEKCEYFKEIDYGYRQSKRCYAQKNAPEVNCNGCIRNCVKYPKIGE